MRTIHLKWTVVLCVAAVIALVMLTVHVHYTTSKDAVQQGVWSTLRGHNSRDCIDSADVTDKQHGAIKSNLVQLTKSLKKARQHARGGKTRDALGEAVLTLQKVLNVFDLNVDTIPLRTEKKSPHICPEEYKGTTYGYPFFYKGFEVTNCTYGQTVDKLVTIALVYVERDVYDIKTVLDGIYNYNKRFSVKLAVSSKNKYVKEISAQYQNIEIREYNTMPNIGRVWNELISSIRTEYTLIAPHITMFNEDTRVERLLREMERLQLAIAGGASRDMGGHWKLGCYQRAYKNYTMVYVEGYDESFHECVFCDQIDGPFVIKTDTATKTKFDESIELEGLFEDFFYRLKGEIAVCPDSMFHVNKTDRSNLISGWRKFSEKYALRRLKYANEIDIDFGCKNGKYACFGGTGYAVTPCCLEELANMVKLVMKLCDENGIICELQEGTLLGAVKLEKVLPWERDADLTFLTANYSSFKNLEKYIRNAGYSFTDGASLWCCVDNRTAGGKFKIASTHWHIELYGQHLMDSEMLIENKIIPTKVRFDGQWVGVPRNPGWHARNRYGLEIYAHSQHWLSTGKSSGWINYQTNYFTKCLKPGAQNCLDHYNADGNLPFSEPIP